MVHQIPPTRIGHLSSLESSIRPDELNMQANYAELHVGALLICQGRSSHDAPISWLHDLLHDIVYLG